MKIRRPKNEHIFTRGTCVEKQPFGGGVNVSVDINLQKRQCFDGIKQLFDIAGIFFRESNQLFTRR